MLGCVAVMVSDDVGEGLGGDAVGGDLDRGRQVAQGALLFDRHRQRGEAVCVLADRAHQAEVVEGGRAEAVHHPSDLGQRVGELAPRRSQQHIGLRRVGGDRVAGRIDRQGDAGEPGAEPVVQVTAESSPFLLAHLDQPVTTRPEGDRRPCGIDDAGELGHLR